jgi:hypothetical protein
MLGGSPGVLPNITGWGLTILYLLLQFPCLLYGTHFGSAEQSAEEQLHQCSVCDSPAKYKLDEEMRNHASLAQHFAEFAEAGKRHSKA